MYQPRQRTSTTERTLLSRSPLLSGGFAALCAALAVTAPSGAPAAPTETVLYAFTGGGGAIPLGGLIADISGNLYGMTSEGGASGNGVVFKLSPGGTGTVLYSFCSKPGCSDGALPQGGALIADSSGNLYGTTQKGGGTGCGGSGCGVVFKLSPGGTETVLYSFCPSPPGTCSDGALSGASLIADGGGNLYGTTFTGGGSPSGCGVVFKLAPGGTYTVLHAFGGSDGCEPEAGLLADSSGNLYGATQLGGTSGKGTVFKLSPGGTGTVLYSFTGGSDGAKPFAGLIADSSGNLYGTTGNGGGTGCSGDGCGVVFKLSPGGAETVLYSFCSKPGCTDGRFPGIVGLIADSSGNLYGTTFSGGASSDRGVVFKLSPPIPPATKWTETVLYSFCSKSGCNDGAFPQGGALIADSGGNLYGTTSSGGGTGCAGGSGCGVVFTLTGTGFNTVPFSDFSGKLEIDLEGKPNKDRFELLSSFTLGSASNGINPVTEPVTLQIGTFTTTIPAGSFKELGQGIFVLHGVIGGVRLEALIAPTGSLRYALVAAARDANLTGTTNPVPVTLTIGDDGGTASVQARIEH